MRVFRIKKMGKLFSAELPATAPVIATRFSPHETSVYYVDMSDAPNAPAPVTRYFARVATGEEIPAGETLLPLGNVMFGSGAAFLFEIVNPTAATIEAVKTTDAETALLLANTAKAKAAAHAEATSEEEDDEATGGEPS